LSEAPAPASSVMFSAAATSSSFQPTLPETPAISKRQMSQPTQRPARREAEEFGEPRVAMPLAGCIRQSGWGLPTVAPEVILFFKATLYVGTKNHLRPRDEADFAALLPLLTDEQRAWLREAVSSVYVGEHPWLRRL